MADESLTRRKLEAVGRSASTGDMEKKASLGARQVPIYVDDASTGSLIFPNYIDKSKDVKRMQLRRLDHLEAELAAVRLNILESSRQTSLVEERNSIESQGVETSQQNLLPTRLDEVTSMLNVVNLPSVELSTFDGNPATFVKFMKQFEFYVEAKVADPGQRLLRLIHYCRGQAKVAIEECVMLPPKDGYHRAKNILSTLFGRPSVVTKSMIDEMLAAARKGLGDSGCLMTLAIKMQNCHIALQHLQRESELDNLFVMNAVVSSLPLSLQYKWAEEADRITNHHEPNFAELTDFILNRARVATSRYGQLAEGTSRKSRTNYPSPKLNTFKTTSLLHNKEEIICRLCGDRHKLFDCGVFNQKTVPERWAAAKRIGVCFKCLEPTHISSVCHVRPACSVGSCTGNHHTLLHHEVRNTEEDLGVRAANVNAIQQGSQKSTRLNIVPVYVESPNGVIKTLAFLDNGSDTTLIDKSFAIKNNLSKSPTSLTVTTVSGVSQNDCFKVSLKLVSKNGCDTINIFPAYTVTQIPVRPVVSIKDEARRWPHLRDIPFEDLVGEVTILIGCDYPEVHWALEQRVNDPGQPYAVKTLLGWVMYGPVKHGSNALVACNCVEEESVKTQLHLLYNQEFMDVSSHDTALSRNDQKVIDMIERESQLVDGRVEVPIPWKPNLPKLENNFEQAYRRLTFFRRRLNKDKELLLRYGAGLQHFLDKGYLEPVPLETLGSAWYMPHHPVFNAKKPGKLRIVFDCAAKFKGSCLNDVVYSGPDTTTPLLHVLLRFRLHKVAVAADIEEMFLQVRVPKGDRDFLRILWRSNDNSELQAFRMTVHPFGVTSSPYCANYALQKVIKTFGSKVRPEVNTDTTRYFYVDDCLASLPDSASAAAFATGLSKVLAMGGFHLTKWISNERNVLEGIPVGDRAAGVKDLYTSRLPTENTLGIRWDVETDGFIFVFDWKERPFTRRGLLSALAGLYDPMGLVAPWLMPGKILLQTLCKKGLEWDTELHLSEKRILTSWIDNMKSLQELRIARCLCTDPMSVLSYELHVFCDASEVGYGAVAYVRFRQHNQHSSMLLMSKSRVAPIKSVSIPRLELSAAVLAVRLSDTIRKVQIINFGKTFYWSDSTIVLHYIRNESSRFCTFVANRLTVIHDHTEVTQWRYVPTELNPADKLSRGVKERPPDKTWTCGPHFLSLDDAMWPQMIIDVTNEDVEYRHMPVSVNLVNVHTFWNKVWERYSSWTRLIRSIAWLTRYKSYFQLLVSGDTTITLPLGSLKLKELYMAEKTIIAAVQRESLTQDIQHLQTNRQVSKRSHLRKLNPIYADGLLRVSSRLCQSNLDFDCKYPIILPTKHQVTTLIVRHYHDAYGHVGSAHVLAVIRRKFWLLNGLSCVKRVLRDCFQCRRTNALPGEQLMAPLPPVRVTPGWFPFSDVGLDYFGPFHVKQGRGLLKRYGCLFTCLKSRAVHIEVAHSLTTNSFLMTLNRFVARRGTPHNIYSDNGSNIVGAQHEIKRCLNKWNQDSIARELTSKDIQWHFNPPYASHRGGVWERMIRSVRKVAQNLCSEQATTDEILLTTMTEVERILNSRPIVPVITGDVESMALSPNDLLLLRNDSGMELCESLYHRYQSGWKQAQYLARVFWKRWTTEYLTTLSIRQKWLVASRNFKVGDVVLVRNDSIRRREWPLGRVVGTIQDDDGYVRTADIQTKHGIIRRDIRHLVWLEGDSTI